MIISRKHAFIFFAMNKTASSSIQKVLRPEQDRLFYRWLRIQYYVTRGDRAVFKHVQPSALRELMGRRTWERYFKFCFVRNPFDRLVSLYFYHRQIKPHRHPAASSASFEQWLLSGGSGSAGRSMSDFVCDDNGKVLVDFIGKYENLQHDFDLVCQRIGLDVQLLHRNRSHHEHYSAYYTERARRLVESRFARDLEMFGYQFEDVPTTAEQSDALEHPAPVGP